MRGRIEALGVLELAGDECHQSASPAGLGVAERIADQRGRRDRSVRDLLREIARAGDSEIGAEAPQGRIGRFVILDELGQLHRPFVGDADVGRAVALQPEEDGAARDLEP